MVEDKKVLIRLNEDWEANGTTYDAGKQLRVDEETAKKLVADGTAVDVEAEKKKKKAEEAELEKLQAVVQASVKASMAEFRAAVVKADVHVVEVEEQKIEATGGFKNFPEFVQAVHRRTIGSSHPLAKKMEQYESRLKTVMEEGDDAQGGFLVPTEFRNQLLQTAVEDTVFADKVTFIPMQTNHIEIPAIFDEGHDDNPKEFFGGVTIYRPEEGGTKTFSKPHFGLIELNLHEVAGICAVTNNLLEDSPMSIGAMLNTLFGQAISWVLDDDTIQGNGVGKPLGILHCDSCIEINKETDQADDTVVAANVLNMYARMPQANRKNAIWLANNGVLPQLAAMTIGNYPVFMPAGGMSQKPFDTLLGKPLYFTEKLPALGDAGDIMFIDPKSYVLGGKNGMSIQTASSIHLYFDMDQTCFRFTMRYDGTCWWKTYFTPKHGDTMAPCVKIQNRETI